MRRSYCLSFAGEKQAKLFQLAYNGIVPPEADIPCPLDKKHHLDINLGTKNKHNLGRLHFSCECRSNDHGKKLSWYSSELPKEKYEEVCDRFKDWEQEWNVGRRNGKKRSKTRGNQTVKENEVAQENVPKKTKGDNAAKAVPTVTTNKAYVEIKRVPQPFPMSPPSRPRNATPGPSGQKCSPSPLDMSLPPTPPATSPAKPLDKGKRRADELASSTPAKRQKLEDLVELTDSEDEDKQTKKSKASKRKWKRRGAGYSQDWPIDLTQD
ncbi:hypothetical protein VKT23_015316 [Stygiomarasmius scandens]|uniref:Uncharacterized protein n=1 Tax=Marasmiellus scandens TaxID=2682957 RepID=A0ABR1J2J3_9AGAR